MHTHNPEHRHSGFLSVYWPHLILCILVSVLFAKNYTPGTWLTGWDNLHPEFDFATNIIDRSFFSAWQQYQGLGVRAGNAHAADIFRQIALFLLSFLLQPSLLRYVYHFFALCIGAIGIYELVTRVHLPKHQLSSQLAATVAAIFSILNLGTMQNFYVPYESFSHAFAAFPWLLLACYRYLASPSKRTLLFLIFINFLAIPMFYIPTIFLVYCIILCCICLAYVLHTHSLKTVTILATVVLCVNAFWLLPFGAFILHGTSFVSSVKINKMFTQEAFLRNQKFGTVTDITMLRGFLFDTTDMANTKTGENEYMMKPWITYLHKQGISQMHIMVGLIALIGLCIGLFRKRPFSLASILIGIVVLIALCNDNPPTKPIFDLVTSLFPLLKQVFRFPFTKFIVPAIVIYASGIALSVEYILSVFLHKKIPRILFFIVFACGLMWINIPSFQGNFIYSKMRQTIPDEYMQVMKFFHTEPNGKIANFPQPSFWGWMAYSWGYRGSGFPWYGIQQPILDRAFDVWNTQNEQYYTDITRALYTEKTPEAIEKIFDLYNITYLWIDKTVILPHKPELLYVSELQTLVDTSVRFSKQFETPTQVVYRFDKEKIASAISVAEQVKPIIYPYATDRTTQISTDPIGNIQVKARIPSGTLLFPSIYSSDHPIPSTISKTDTTYDVMPLVPKIYNNGIPLSIPKESFIRITPPNFTGFVQLNDHLISEKSDAAFLLYPTNNLLITYPVKPNISESITEKIHAEPLKNCLQTARTNTIFGSVPDDHMFNMYGTQSHPCIYNQLSSFLRVSDIKTAIIQIHVVYKQSAQSVSKLCLTRDSETGCFFEYDLTGSNVNEEWKKADITVPIREYPLGNIWMKIELSADSNTEQQIMIRDASIDIWSKPNSTFQFSAPMPQKPVEIPVKSGTLTLLYPKDFPGTATLQATEFPNQKTNCFSLGNGSYDKTLQTDADGSFVRYSAFNSSSCDYTSFSNTLFTSGAIATFLTRTISGRPLKTCIKIDPPGFCLIEDILANKSAWNTSSFLLPPVIPNASSRYFIELDNYAVGKEIRVNDLASISFIPISYDWIRSIQMMPDSISAVSIDPAVSKAINSSYSNPTLYVIDIDSILRTNKNSTVVLSQSFDDGWIALTRSKSFPFLKQIGKHVLVNNWENGFTLRPEDFETTGDKGHQTIYLLFWPQLLEWIGFLLLPIPFLVAGRMKMHA